MVIKVDNGARSNWKVAHAHKTNESNWTAIEKFELESGDNGTDEHVLVSDTKDLKDTAMLWRVTACGTVSGAERATFTWNIVQDDEVIYSKDTNRQTPQCNSNSAAQFRNMFVFKFHSKDDKKNNIWDVIS